jgi:hypothetical protein
LSKTNLWQALKFACLLYVAMTPLLLKAQFTYSTNQDGTLTITGCSNSVGSVVIPDTINGLPVTGIGGQVFYEAFFLTNVIIGANVTTIGDQAFYTCEELASVTIPNGVASIGFEAFEDCLSLTNVTITWPPADRQACAPATRPTPCD